MKRSAIPENLSAHIRAAQTLADAIREAFAKEPAAVLADKDDLAALTAVREEIKKAEAAMDGNASSGLRENLRLLERKFGSESSLRKKEAAEARKAVLAPHRIVAVLSPEEENLSAQARTAIRPFCRPDQIERIIGEFASIQNLRKFIWRIRASSAGQVGFSADEVLQALDGITNGNPPWKF